MSKQKVRQICEGVQKYYIDRMCDFCEDNRAEDATALYEEIKEWLIKKDKPTILSLKTIKRDSNQTS